MTGLGAPSPIGLDLSAATVRAVQVAGSADEARIVAAAWFERLDPGVLPTRREVERLAEVLDRHGFRGSRVVAAVPDDKLLTGMFELASAGAPVETISRVELARASGCGPQSLEVAAWTLPKPDRARSASHVMAVGCGHADADAYLNAIEAGGIEVVGLEARPVALARACGPVTAARSGISAVMELDWGATVVSVMYNGAMIYERTSFDVGAGAMLATLRERLGVDEDLARHLLLRAPRTDGESDGPLPAHGRLALDEQLDLLAEELTLAITYASHRYPEPSVDLVLLTGEGASIPAAAARLAERLQTEVRPLRPAEVVGVGAGLERVCASPALATALGLALGAAGGDA